MHPPTHSQKEVFKKTPPCSNPPTYLRHRSGFSSFKKRKKKEKNMYKLLRRLQSSSRSQNLFRTLLPLRLAQPSRKVSFKRQQNPPSHTSIQPYVFLFFFFLFFFRERQRKRKQASSPIHFHHHLLPKPQHIPTHSSIHAHTNTAFHIIFQSKETSLPPKIAPPFPPFQRRVYTFCFVCLLIFIYLSIFECKPRKEPLRHVCMY
jgi:hypothetical protein